ncbi:hypothetical protein Trydic_g3855 [Trypoxylus dichotomus]
MKTVFVLLSLVVVSYSYVSPKCEPSQCHNVTCYPLNNVVRLDYGCDYCCLVCMWVVNLRSYSCRFTDIHRSEITLKLLHFTHSGDEHNAPSTVR